MSENFAHKYFFFCSCIKDRPFLNHSVSTQWVILYKRILSVSVRWFVWLLVGGFVCSMVELLDGCMDDWMVRSVVDSVVGVLVASMVGGSGIVRCWVGWSVGCLLGWLPGWFDGRPFRKVCSLPRTGPLLSTRRLVCLSSSVDSLEEAHIARGTIRKTVDGVFFPLFPSLAHLPSLGCKYENWASILGDGRILAFCTN